MQSQIAHSTPYPTGLAAILDREERGPTWVRARMQDPKPSVSAISRWANGKNRIPRDRVEELARIFNVDPSEIR